MRNAMKIVGLVSTLVFAACGADQDEAVAFVGTWQPTSGTMTTTCPGYAAETNPITTNWVWSPGVSSDIVGTDASSSCALMADVSSVTASAVPGQTCTVPIAEGSLAVGYTGYTFVLGPDGKTASENGSGTLTYVGGGLSATCAFSQTASYRKIGH